MADEPDLTIYQVAELLDVRPDTVHNWCERGNVFPHAYLLPGDAGYRIPREDVARLKDGGLPSDEALGLETPRHPSG